MARLIASGSAAGAHLDLEAMDEQSIERAKKRLAEALLAVSVRAKPA
jgi:hypothetical protein